MRIVKLIFKNQLCQIFKVFVRVLHHWITQWSGPDPVASHDDEIYTWARLLSTFFPRTATLNFFNIFESYSFLCGQTQNQYCRCISLETLSLILLLHPMANQLANYAKLRRRILAFFARAAASLAEVDSYEDTKIFRGHSCLGIIKATAENIIRIF